MMVGKFSASGWIDLLARALLGLSEAQKSCLSKYLGQHQPVPDESGWRFRCPPGFPLDDLHDLYTMVRHRHVSGEEKQYAVLCTELDSVRYILRSHPTLESVVSRIVGRDDFWVQILGRGALTSLTNLIVGLMARAGELSGDGFHAAASELNTLLVAAGGDKTAGVPGDLDIGYDMVLFHGLSLREKFEIGSGMTIVPFEQVRTFVDGSVLEDVAPTVIKYDDWQSVGAVIKPFRWKPEFRRTGDEGGSELDRPGPFFREAQDFLELLAVSHGVPVVCLVAVFHCISQSACRLLGQVHDRGNVYWGRSAHLFDRFPGSSELLNGAFNEARTAFEERKSERYRNVAPVIGRLAEALARGGQYAAEDKVLDVVIVLERMFKPKDGRISAQLQERVADFLGSDDEAQSRVKKAVKHVYDVRSAIIHGPKDEKKGRLLKEKDKAFDEGFGLARRSLFKMLGEGPSQQ